MKEKTIVQFNGNLEPNAIAAGMNVARRNSTRLLADAKVLLSNASWPSAVALAILSIEESGKISILRSLAVARDALEAKKCWKEYRSHTRKNLLGGLPDLVRRGARALEDFRGLFDPKAQHPILIEQLKQISTYSDCYGKAHWSEPSDIIEKELAKQLVGTAEILLPRHDVTTREIELWVLHVGPVWKQDFGLMKEAVANWYASMVAEGLASGDSEDMNRFIWPSSPYRE